MYAVIATGGKQYKVAEGDNLRVERLEGDVGSRVTFDRVLMVGAGADSKIGKPVLDGATVEAEIKDQNRAKKIKVFKFQRREKYRRRYGHRQPYTELKITKISA